MNRPVIGTSYGVRGEIAAEANTARTHLYPRELGHAQYQLYVRVLTIHTHLTYSFCVLLLCCI